MRQLGYVYWVTASLVQNHSTHHGPPISGRANTLPAQLYQLALSEVCEESTGIRNERGMAQS